MKINRFKNGKDMPTELRECGNCKGEFYVPNISKECETSFCPYCGIKFKTKIETIEDSSKEGDT